MSERYLINGWTIDSIKGDFSIVAKDCDILVCPGDDPDNHVSKLIAEESAKNKIELPSVLLFLMGENGARVGDAYLVDSLENKFCDSKFPKIESIIYTFGPRAMDNDYRKTQKETHLNMLKKINLAGVPQSKIGMPLISAVGDYEQPARTATDLAEMLLKEKAADNGRTLIICTNRGRDFNTLNAKLKEASIEFQNKLKEEYAKEIKLSEETNKKLRELQEQLGKHGMVFHSN